jgi:mannose-6-phosphate isomerase-like protein (cupin superfamily)
MTYNEKKEGVPDWIGNTPFPPEKKRVCRITRDMYVGFLYGFETTQVENQVFACTDMIFMAEWTLPPGNHYEPPGYHLHGDECYYLLEGDATAFNPETGETFTFGKGDAMIIPQRTRHQIFNMTDKKIVAIACVAPAIWADDGMGTIIPKVETPRFYKGNDKPAGGRKEPPYSIPRLKKNIDSLGLWPAPGPELRKAKQLVIVRPHDQLALIHGVDRHVLFSFVVSSDFMHLAVLTAPVGCTSEFETHNGDEVINVLEGELCVRVSSSKTERSDDATYPHYRLLEGDKMFIPAGVTHQYMNFVNDPVKAYIAVAPGL